MGFDVLLADGIVDGNWPEAQSKRGRPRYKFNARARTRPKKGQVDPGLRARGEDIVNLFT